MLMRQVVDLGHQKSSRKKKKKTIEMKETKFKIELEVENHQKTKPRKSPIMLEKIRRFEDQDQTRKLIPKIKPKFYSEVEKISKLAAKKKQEDEALQPKACKLKMTSPPISSHRKVKTEAFRRRMSRCESPRLLTRMKPLKTAKIETLLKLTKPDARHSPVKPRNFNLLLDSWEQTSNVILTPVVASTPSLRSEMDSQSEKTLEKSEKISPGVGHPIGQENLERGMSGKYNQ